MTATPTVPNPVHPDDRGLLRSLRRMWERLDPPPADLADRSLVAVAVDDLDLELLLLTDDASRLVGARGEETARTLTFSGDCVSVMVTITRSRRHHYRLDGWVAPLGEGRVELRHSAGRDVAGPVDADGRFVLRDVPAGTVQLVYHPDARAVAGGPPVLRSVAAPPVHL
ncbi:carboxypeptidase regulatory-like domain-containing protein [Thalassiella azotivora]